MQPRESLIDADRVAFEPVTDKPFARQIWIAFWLGLLIVALLGLWGIHAIRILIERGRWVAHTHSVIETLQAVRENACQADSMARAFALSGNLAYNADAQQAIGRASAQVRRALDLTTDNPAQRRDLTSIAAALSQRSAFDRALLATRDRAGLDAAVTMASHGAGLPLSQALDQAVSQSMAAEYALLHQRDLAAEHAGLNGLEVIAAGLVFTLLCGGFVGWNIRRALFALRTQAGRLAVSAGELHDQTILWRSIFEGMSEAVIAYDRDGRVILHSPAAGPLRTADQWGLNLHEIMARHEYFTESGAPLPLEEIPAIAALAGQSCDNRVYLSRRRADGYRLWIEASARPLYDDDRAIKGAVVVVRDISDRRRAEEQRAHLAEIIRCSSESIESVTLDGVVISWNPGAEGLYGYASAEIVGQPLAVIEAPQRRGELADRFARFRTDPTPQRLETLRRRKDGAIIEVALTLSQVRDRRGGIIGISAIARDITAHKKLVRELDQRRAELEERTRDLERSNEDLSHFAYSASHDLQEPLRMVSGFVQLLRDRYHGRLDRDADEFIDFALEGATRMKQLIDGVLQYSRAGRGAEFVPLDAADPLNFALANLGALIAESGAHIEAGAMPRVRGDRGQLAELFQNLVSNGIKFRGAQPCKITIGAAPLDGAWEFAVADNGIGLDPAHAGRIFQMFQRLHTREEYEGTGIGLAICRKIVERHGGRIWVDSAPSRGATFRFTLPAAEAES